MFFLSFARTDMRLILENILRDITFLSSFNLMDYSLFLIVETNSDYSRKKEKKFKNAIKRAISKKEESDKNLLKLDPTEIM